MSAERARTSYGALVYPRTVEELHESVTLQVAHGQRGGDHVDAPVLTPEALVDLTWRVLTLEARLDAES